MLKEASEYVALMECSQFATTSGDENFLYSYPLGQDGIIPKAISVN
jgi:hypothetical protein